MCRARGLRLLVDGVSSFGAEPIDFADTSLDAVAATANKCLHGVPGASFVLVRRAALAQAASRTYYLDLGRLARLQDQRNTPFTPSVHAYYALVEALRELADEGGWRARHARYAALAEQARVGPGRAWASASVLPPEQSSVVLRAYRLPDGIAYPQLHDALKARGFVIYAGQGGLSAELFRISTMGNIHAADIDRLLQGFYRTDAVRAGGAAFTCRKGAGGAAAASHRILIRRSIGPLRLLHMMTRRRRHQRIGLRVAVRIGIGVGNRTGMHVVAHGVTS